MERFADPNILQTMTTAEKLFDSLIVMLLGIGITFVVLIILMFCISLLRVLFQDKAPKTTPGVTNHPSKPAAVPAKPTDDELLAVITAAIMASQDDVIAVIAAAVAAMEIPGTKLRIQSIKVVTPSMPAYAHSGLLRNMRRI